MTNIKTFNELRKLIKDTKWTTIKFTSTEVLDWFPENQRDNFHSINKDEFYFDRDNLYKRIDKKLQADVYGLRLLPVKRRKYTHADTLYNSLTFENVKSFTIYELAGEKSKYNIWYPAEIKFWIDDYTNQIVYVKYYRKDIWFNNYFKGKIDNSVQSNYDEIWKEKTYHLAYEQALYKIVTCKGLDYQDARSKFEKSNPLFGDSNFNYEKHPKRWEHLFKIDPDKLPEDVKKIVDINDINFDINNLDFGIRKLKCNEYEGY